MLQLSPTCIHEKRKPAYQISQVHVVKAFSWPPSDQGKHLFKLRVAAAHLGKIEFLIRSKIVTKITKWGWWSIPVVADQPLPSQSAWRFSTLPSQNRPLISFKTTNIDLTPKIVVAQTSSSHKLSFYVVDERWLLCTFSVWSTIWGFSSRNPFKSIGNVRWSPKSPIA
jgi:hypothetical protein